MSAQQLTNASGEKYVGVTTVGSKNGLDVNLVNTLVPEVYDYVDLSYTGVNLTSVVYKTGGSSGTTVATLTLAYTGAVLISVTKT